MGLVGEVDLQELAGQLDRLDLARLRGGGDLRLHRIHPLEIKQPATTDQANSATAHASRREIHGIHGKIVSIILVPVALIFNRTALGYPVNLVTEPLAISLRASILA